MLKKLFKEILPNTGIVKYFSSRKHSMKRSNNTIKDPSRLYDNNPEPSDNKKSKNSVFWILLRISAYGFLLAILAGGYGTYELWKVYSSEETTSKINVIKSLKPIDNTIIYDKDGKVLTEKYSTYHKFVEISRVPQTFKDAIISIEDRRFYQHFGIDIKAILRAAVEVISTGKPKQGGSTITQQLVRHYLLSRDKNIWRKVQEIILSLRLEQELSKDKILELYLNNIFLGSGSNGIGAAAERYFGKPLNEISLSESALIAGLFQAPSRYNPFKRPKLAIKRQRQVLKAMVANNKLSSSKARRIAKQKIKLVKFSNNTKSMHAYYADYVTEEAKKVLGVRTLDNKGYRIYTALDQDLNEKSYQSIQEMKSKFTEIENNNNLQKTNNMMQAASVVLDVKTGEIVSMIGGRDYATSEFNIASQAKRAPGSSFKPIVYSLALENGYKWSDVFYVAPVTLAGTYRPRTEKSDYLSESTMLRALFKSMNATTMEIGAKIGLSKIVARASAMGIESPVKYEYGSLLGQSEVTLIDMTRVYSTFANNGSRISPVTIRKITDMNGNLLYESEPLEKRVTKVLSPQTNYLMTKGLQKVLSHGTARSAANISHVAGGKTGTTNGSVDNWFCGYTKDYVSIVWTGPNTPQILRKGNIQGSTLALPIWKNIMEHTIAKNAPLPFTRPSGVTSLRVHPEFGHLSSNGMEMWFTSGNLPKRKSSSLEVLEKKGNRMRGFGVH